MLTNAGYRIAQNLHARTLIVRNDADLVETLGDYKLFKNSQRERGKPFMVQYRSHFWNFKTEDEAKEHIRKARENESRSDAMVMGHRVKAKHPKLLSFQSAVIVGFEGAKDEKVQLEFDDGTEVTLPVKEVR